MVPGMIRALLFTLSILLCGCKTSPQVAIPPEYAPRDGDFLFQSLPRNALVDCIEGSTGSPFSHCGIVVNRDGNWRVLEAIGPVKETPLGEWIARGRDNAYVAYRLNPPLAARIPEIITAAERYKGRPYDIHYELDDAKIYCSELLWKATWDAAKVRLGSPHKLGDLKWQPHEAVIRQIENGGLPLEREIITPRTVAEDPHLREVFRFRM